MNAALQTSQTVKVTRRRLHAHSLSPVTARPTNTPSSTSFSVASSMPSIYIACAAATSRSASGRRLPSPSTRPPLPRSSPPGVVRRPVAARQTGTCRGAGRPTATGLSEKTRTYSSVKTAVRVTADNEASLSRFPISSGLHKAIADELCQQVCFDIAMH